MSTQSFQAVTMLRDSKQLELVKKIADRTREGKIVWHKSATEFSATMGEELYMSFIYSYSVPPPVTVWKLFTVRGKEGNELLQVENTFADALYAMLHREPPEPDPVLNAVDELYRVVDRGANGDIDHAIAVLDKA